MASKAHTAPLKQIYLHNRRGAGRGTQRGPSGSLRRGPSAKCPSPVGGALLSHGLPPQYHRRSGA